MSSVKLVYRYSPLNMLVFEQKGFFRELLRVAMQRKMISLKEGVECDDLMMRHIINEFESHVAGNEILKELPECKEYFIDNHLYMLSLYLYERYTPAKALMTIMYKSAKQLYKESVEHFEKVSDNTYEKILEFGNEIYMNEAMRGKYFDLCKDIKVIKEFNECKGRLDNWTEYDTWSETFLPLNYYEYMTCDVINFFRKLLDAFAVEVNILNELKSEKSDLLCELLDFAYDAIRKKVTYLPKNNDAKTKRKIVLERSTDEVLKMMFSCNNGIEFSAASKEYISRYFFRKLERGPLYYE